MGEGEYDDANIKPHERSPPLSPLFSVPLCHCGELTSPKLLLLFDQLQANQSIGAAHIEQAVRQDRRSPGGIT